MADIEVTVVARFDERYAPVEEEWRALVEDQWNGDLLGVEDEDV